MNSYTTVWDMKPFLEMIPLESSVAEFGVYTGTSIEAMLNILENQIHPKLWTPLRIYGFDSFLGLPAEAPNVYDNSAEWPVGAFNGLEHWKVDSVEKVIECLQEKWSKFQNKVKLIPGWYNETLTWKLAEDLHYNIVRFGYIHIDTDIYKSSYECMDWLFGHHLVENGAIFRFDDWYSVPLWQGGESLAFKEISQKYGLKWDILSGNVFRWTI